VREPYKKSAERVEEKTGSTPPKLDNGTASPNPRTSSEGADLHIVEKKATQTKPAKMKDAARDNAPRDTRSRLYLQETERPSNSFEANGKGSGKKKRAGKERMKQDRKET